MATVDFTHSYSSQDGPRQLIVPIELPFCGEIKELVIRIMAQNQLPCYFEDELTEQLSSFIIKETKLWRDKKGDEIMQEALKEKTFDNQVNKWVTKYTDNHAHFSTLKEAPEDPFPAIYHHLIHSPALNTLLQLEHTYSIAMNDICRAGKNAITNMQKRHDSDLERTMQELGVNKTDNDVNKLMRQQIIERKALEEKWLQEVKGQQDTQRQEYRDWLTRVNEEMTDDHAHKHKGKKSALSELKSQQSNLSIDDRGLSDGQPLMEESFTIHLGAQQKSSHNLRLICGDVLSLCRDSNETDKGLEGEMMRLNPRRIQTAMSLYTNDSSALVIMTDREVNTITGLKEVFADICRQSTDFHFPSIDEQLVTIQKYAYQIKQTRDLISDNLTPKHEGRSQKTSPARTPEKRSRDSSVERDSGIQNGEPLVPPIDLTLLHPGWSHSQRTQSNPPLSEEEPPTLEPGDFYLTRHSNLSQVHVVCHLVSEEKAILNSSLSTRHPIMQGLKNTLRTISKHGLHHVIIPLLLTHQMKPDMTINWCLKRAELVFKTVKGFLLECTSWRGDVTWTVQFLIPEGISEDLFEQISELLSKTFRTSVSRTLT